MTSLATSWLTIAVAALISCCTFANASQTPWQQIPAFANALEQAKARHADQFASLPDVPVPVDAGGGYTHEQHKRNALALFEAGMLYHWTGDQTYANHARDLLLAYAQLYPTLSEHPQKKEQSPGRLFWQSLNEAVWLVHTARGYGAIRDTLDDTSREIIETQLLRTMVRFLSEESPQTFNRIHNHGTWAVAATGITGYVLGDDTMVERALLGLEQDGEAGFLRQMDELFSPDGYYNEGPYYQRYALMPFVLFARAIDQNQPQRKIFEHRDGILMKAIHTAIQLSYGGYFFPLNDAIKDKGLDTIELDYAIPIAYAKTSDPSYLSLIGADQSLVLTKDALHYATAQANGDSRAFEFVSQHLRDGPNGDRGALNVMREGDAQTGRALIFKATSHGLGHGHFDRLNWLYYDDGEEVVTDYGAARFLNIVQKNGGHYLPENNSWAKQSVAHNSFVADQTSQFDGDAKAAEQSTTEQHFFSLEGALQIASAREAGAYANTTVDRTMIMVDAELTGYPLVLDVMRASSDEARQFDVPVYFRGQTVSTREAVKTDPSRLAALGTDDGYQHLWDLGHYASAARETDTITWLGKRRFYSQSTLSNQTFDTHMIRVGATDPNFNLRPEPGVLRRYAPTTDLSVVSVLATHGEYNGAREYTLDSLNPVAALEHQRDDKRDLISVYLRDGQSVCVALSYDARPKRKHGLATPRGKVHWRGFAQIVECMERVASLPGTAEPAQEQKILFSKLAH